MSRLGCDKCSSVWANTVMVLVRGGGVFCIDCHNRDKIESREFHKDKSK